MHYFLYAFIIVFVIWTVAIQGGWRFVSRRSHGITNKTGSARRKG